MILTIIGIVAAVFTIFWPSIRSFLSTQFLPFVRQHYGEKFAAPLTSLTVWLDRQICFVRKGIAEAVRFIRTRILRMETRVVMTPDGTVIGGEVTELDNGDGTVTIMKKPSALDFTALPQKMQDELLRQQASKDGYKTGIVDQKGLLGAAVGEKLKNINKNYPTELAPEQADGMTDKEVKRELAELAKEAKKMAPREVLVNDN